MQSKSPEALARILIDSGFTAKKPIVGCSEEEIQLAEQKFGTHFPEAYKEFLRVMGKETGNFLLDGVLRIDELDLVQDLAKDRLEELQISLPKNSFVFLGRDNFIMYFDTESGDDPAVYILEDGHKEPRKFFDSFSSWLTTCVERDAENRKKNAILHQKLQDKD